MPGLSYDIKPASGRYVFGVSITLGVVFFTEDPPST